MKRSKLLGGLCVLGLTHTFAAALLTAGLALAGCEDAVTGGGNENSGYENSLLHYVTLRSVTADGSESERTTSLTLTFDNAVKALSADDITLSGLAGVEKGEVSGQGPVYTLAVTITSEDGDLVVEASKFGYEMDGTPQKVAVYGAAPASPEGLAMQEGTGKFTVSWMPVKRASSYEVYTGKTAKPEEAAKYGEDVSGASLEISTASGAENYKYVWVKSKNAFGASSFSEGLSSVNPGTLTGVTLTNIASKLEGLGTKEEGIIYQPVTLVFSAAVIDTRWEGLTRSEAWTAALTAIQEAGYNVILDFSACTFADNTISSLAFSGCTALTRITIPESVTSIESDAFEYCTSLTDITIPASVTSLGDGGDYPIFFGCTGLTSITVATANTAYSSADGVLFNNDKTTLVKCPVTKTGAYTIPSGVSVIGSFAFQYCTELTSVAVPESVTSIRDYAFFNCKSLSSIDIPADCGLWDYAFACCTGLKSLTLPTGAYYSNIFTFWYCTSLASLVIPASVSNIYGPVFETCFSLVSVTFLGSSTYLLNVTSSSSYKLSETFPYGYSLLVAGGDFGAEGTRSYILKMAKGTYTREPDGKVWTKL